jgi:NAD(P)-dependent dehydrogenase (short-subunit alcohol dehydrogenase family)
MSSEKKVAVITGASQGMGAALVEAYRDRGYGGRDGTVDQANQR